MTYDPVNKPSHYTEGRELETIDVIEDWGLDFHLGNAVKYISRAGRKDPEKLNQDISKAIWYLERFQDMHADRRKKASQEEIEFKALGEIPGSIQFGVDDDIYAAAEVPFDASTDELNFTDTVFGQDTYATFDKDLSKFEDDDVIVTTFLDGEFMIGKQKDGGFRIVGRADGSELYDEVLKSDPLDLTPFEFEPMHDA